MEDLFGKIQEVLSDPESMKQVTELAQMLKTETDGSPAPPAEESQNAAAAPDISDILPFDPTMLLKFGEILGSAQKPDQNTELLMALRPHLREERREKVDRAVKLLRLLAIWHVLKDSGMLQNFL